MRTLFCLFAIIIAFQSKAQDPQIIKTASEKELIPEGIAVDAATGIIYVSSIAKQKIIALGPDGKLTEFVNGQGYLEGLGMKVDNKNNLLWTLSNKKEGKVHTSKVMAFNLKTGKLVKELVSKDTVQRLFNDLTIDASGTIYFTDTYYSSVLKVAPNSDKIEIFAKEEKLKYPNGITIGNNHLYVATYAHGLIRINLATKEVNQVPGYSDTAIAHSLDGLIYWNNTLLGVYNGAKDNSGNAIVQYVLNDEGDKILTERIVERGHVEFKEPTTIDIANDVVYVLANSHLAAYNVNKESVKGVESQLSPIVVLKYSLK